MSHSWVEGFGLVEQSLPHVVPLFTLTGVDYMHEMIECGRCEKPIKRSESVEAFEGMIGDIPCAMLVCRECAETLKK